MNLLTLAKVLWRLARLRRNERWTRGQLQAHQARALHQLRQYVYAHSPFYRRFHRGLADRPLHELPILTKAVLMEHFDEVVTDRTIRLRDVEAYLAAGGGLEPFLGRYVVNCTSGSTGRRGIFLASDAEWTTILASLLRPGV
jgi:phenylacetate-CoA ligase